MDVGEKSDSMKHNPDPTGTDDASLATNLDEMVLQYSEEYDSLSSAMDEIDSCLDSLEQKNDDLYSKLQQLLQSNKETRKELEDSVGQAGCSSQEGPGEAAEDQSVGGEADAGTNKSCTRKASQSDIDSSCQNIDG